MRFEFFEHTADAKFRAYGKTEEEAFSNAGLAMFSLIADYSRVKGRVKKKIAVVGNDNLALLYNFLEELLFFFETEGFLLHSVDNIEITKERLTATVSGDTDIDKYEIEGEVKAVTYNEMKISKKDGKVTAQVVVDL